jgi:hypothetical protein
VLYSQNGRFSVSLCFDVNSALSYLLACRSVPFTDPSRFLVRCKPLSSVCELSGNSTCICIFAPHNQVYGRRLSGVVSGSVPRALWDPTPRYEAAHHRSSHRQPSVDLGRKQSLRPFGAMRDDATATIKQPHSCRSYCRSEKCSRHRRSPASFSCLRTCLCWIDCPTPDSTSLLHFGSFPVLVSSHVPATTFLSGPD